MILRRLFYVAIMLFIVAFSNTTNAQDNEQYEKFDTIFSQWNTPKTPGVAAGAIHNGKVIYLKGFGSADIQNNVKITPQTKFQVDDLAKQFTVFAILLLEQQGKLSFEDDLRKYLPQLPEYQAPIKIKHLLNHSSGLNNLDPVKELLGIRSNDVFTQDDALRIIGSQTKLNFTPGTSFSFLRSDTEVILLAEIVAKVSEPSFIEYTSEYIFKPLGMVNTTFNNERSILENTAMSYQIDEQTNHNPVNDLTLGATNLYTTAKDLSKWYLNYSNPASKTGELVKKLDTYVTLDNGKILSTSWGKMTYGRYFDHPERGVPKMWQFGIVGGYTSNVFRFHTKNFTSFVIGNNNRYNGMPAMQMAFEVLENDFTEPTIIDFSKANIKKLSKKKLEKYEGLYWNKTNGFAREIYVKNDTLRYKRLESNRETPIVPLGDNTFQFFMASDDKVTIAFKDELFSIVAGGALEGNYHKFQPAKSSNLQLNDYKGLFYNKELDVTYTLYIDENRLVAKNLRNGNTEFHPIIKDVFRSNTLMFSGVNFIRDNQNRIIGFNINTDGVNKLLFQKV